MIRAALTNEHVPSDSKLAQFVGIDAYPAARGNVLRDLFDEQHEGWLTDTALLNRLATERMKAAAEPVRGEGWKWVEIAPTLS
jgi:ParB family chromosome partitioning protein